MVRLLIVLALLTSSPLSAQLERLEVYTGGQIGAFTLTPQFGLSTLDINYGLFRPDGPDPEASGVIGLRTDWRLLGNFGVLAGADYGTTTLYFEILDAREQWRLFPSSRAVSFRAGQVDLLFLPRYTLSGQDFSLSLAAGVGYSIYGSDDRVLYTGVDEDPDPRYYRNVNRIQRNIGANAWRYALNLRAGYRRFGLNLGYRRDFTSLLAGSLPLDIPEQRMALSVRTYSLRATVSYALVYLRPRADRH